MDGKNNPEWAPGFGIVQKFQYLRYTEVGDAGYMHPIVVAGLHYLDTNGFVSGVGWSFYEVKNSITTEAQTLGDADTKLTTDLVNESKARADTAEAKARHDADAKLSEALVADSKMHTDNASLSQTQITNEVKFRGVAVSAKQKPVKMLMPFYSLK